nr:MAG TPA: SSXT protein (N-terminal region) [Microviridae sp.]
MTFLKKFQKLLTLLKIRDIIKLQKGRYSRCVEFAQRKHKNLHKIHN